MREAWTPEERESIRGLTLTKLADPHPERHAFVAFLVPEDRGHNCAFWFNFPSSSGFVRGYCGKSAADPIHCGHDSRA